MSDHDAGTSDKLGRLRAGEAGWPLAGEADGQQGGLTGERAILVGDCVIGSVSFQGLYQHYPSKLVALGVVGGTDCRPVLDNQETLISDCRAIV